MSQSVRFRVDRGGRVAGFYLIILIQSPVLGPPRDEILECPPFPLPTRVGTTMLFPA